MFLIAFSKGRLKHNVWVLSLYSLSPGKSDQKRETLRKSNKSKKSKDFHANIWERDVSVEFELEFLLFFGGGIL